MGFKNPDHDHVEVKKPYRVPMSEQQSKDWSNAVNQAKDIATGKVVPPYLKDKKF